MLFLEARCSYTLLLEVLVLSELVDHETFSFFWVRHVCGSDVIS